MTRFYSKFCLWCWRCKYLTVVSRRLYVTKYAWKKKNVGCFLHDYFYKKHQMCEHKLLQIPPQPHRARQRSCRSEEHRGVNWLVGEHFSATMKKEQIELYLLGNGLFLGSISDHHVHRSPTEPLWDAFKAALFALREQGQRLKQMKPHTAILNLLYCSHLSWLRCICSLWGKLNQAHTVRLWRGLGWAGWWLPAHSRSSAYSRTPGICYDCGATSK